MLLFTADRATLPADVPLIRVGRRLGYGVSGVPDDERPSASRLVQMALTKELPADVDAFRSAFLYLSHHAAATCTDGEPHCSVCPLSADCPEGRKRLEMGSALA
jgi:endonuclease III